MIRLTLFKIITLRLIKSIRIGPDDMVTAQGRRAFSTSLSEAETYFSARSEILVG